MITEELLNQMDHPGNEASLSDSIIQDQVSARQSSNEGMGEKDVSFQGMGEKDDSDFIIDTSSKPEEKKQSVPAILENDPQQAVPQPAVPQQAVPQPAVQQPAEKQEDDVILNGSTVYWGDTEAHVGRHRLAGRSAKKRKQDPVTDSKKKEKPHIVIIEGLNEIDDGQRAVNPYGFSPEKKPGRSKFGVVQKAGNIATALVGGTLQTAVTAATSPILGAFAAYSEITASKAAKGAQEARRHDLIPGWNGAVFEKADASGQEILADRRRVPTVWSRLTPGKAENEDHSQTPPEISVYVDQPKAGSSRTIVWKEVGHVFLGIRYSRFNPMSQKNERYEMRYGFYPQGGYETLSATGAMSAKGVLIPGALGDDFEHGYSVSRRYPATNAQVSTIIKESETYADKGYSMFHRNCTTFVKDMLQAAHLNTGGKIFEEEEIRFSGLSNVVRSVGNAAGPYYDEKLLSDIAGRTKEENQSYAGYGNMKTTKQDIRQFRSSRNYLNPVKRGYTPAVSGENLRRIHGEGNGVLGSFHYAGSLAESADELSFIAFEPLENELADLGQAAQTKATEILPDNLKEDQEKLSQAVIDYFVALGNASDSVSVLDSAAVRKQQELGEENKKDITIEDIARYLTHEELRTGYQGIMKQQETISKGFSEIYRGDPRMEPYVMKILSLLEISARMVSKLYNIKGAENQGGDLGNIRERMNKERRISNDSSILRMSPSMYEAYLQIYKTPAKALESYERLLELSGKGEDRTKEEEKEYKKALKISEVADDYVRSHEYLLQKNKYSQQDMDYIFALKANEKRGMKGDNARQFSDGNSAAGIYQSLALEQIFGGMKESYRKDADKKDLKNLAAFQEWLSEYLTVRAYEHADLLEMMLRGISRVSERHTRESVLKYFNDMFIKGYLDIVAPDYSEEYAGIHLFGQASYANIMKAQNSGFSLLIKTLINKVMKEKRT